MLGGHTFYEPDDYDHIDDILDFMNDHKILNLSERSSRDAFAEMIENTQLFPVLVTYFNIAKVDKLSRLYEDHWLAILYSLGFKSWIARICCITDIDNDLISCVSSTSKMVIAKFANRKFLAISLYSTIKDPDNGTVYRIFDEAADAIISEFPGSFRNNDVIYICYAPFTDMRVTYRLNRYLHYLL